MLTYVGGELCKTCKFEPKDFHGARYKQPFSEKFSNLEVSEISYRYITADSIVSFRDSQLRLFLVNEKCNLGYFYGKQFAISFVKNTQPCS